MKIENKKKLICLAAEMLDEVDVNQLESVEINETNYDNGGVRLSIELTYPAAVQGTKVPFRVNGVDLLSGEDSDTYIHVGQLKKLTDLSNQS